jgi:hypothetical protein
LRHCCTTVSCAKSTEATDTLLLLLLLTVNLKKTTGPKLKDFRDYLNANTVPEIEALREDVEAFAKQFPTIGFEKANMRYQD